jgi:lauroyl/myristoyl acyltransferase
MSDVVGLFLLPMLVAALPWTLGLRLLKWSARVSRTFRKEADAAWANAQVYAGISAEMELDWKWRYRLIRWVERADTWLTLTRSARWWRRRIHVIGDLPEESGGWLLLTFHWGAGNWIWKVLRERGIAAHFLARRPGVSDLGNSRVALWYAQLRGWAFARIGGLGPLYTGGSVGRVEAAWRSGESVVAMLDLPAGAVGLPSIVPLLGREAQLPSRLPQLAVAAHAPVCIFSCGLDLRSGRRTLRIESLARGSDMLAVVARYAAHLDRCLNEQPEYWLMWHEAPALFGQGDQLPG